MGKQRKLICDCGVAFEETKRKFKGVETTIMKCPKCGYETFTFEQAEEFLRQKEIYKLTEKNRKIIKIGNSKGITIPEAFNIKVGQKAKIEVLSPNSFKVVLKNKFM